MASASPARGDGSDVCVKRDAEVPAGELRDALALRLGDRRVMVCDTRPAAGCEVSVARAPAGLLLGVACGKEAAVTDHVPPVPREELARRVAVEAATLLRASALAPPPDYEAPPRVAAAATPPAPHTAITARVGAGSALAPEMGDSTLALLIDARWFVGEKLHLTAGAKLTGRLQQTIAGRRSSVADRAFWLGAGTRVTLAPLFVDAVLAAQYTLPLLETSDGDAVEQSALSRLALRGAATGGLVLHPRLALVVTAAASMSLRERDIVVNGNDDALDLGFSMVDVVAGLEVGF